MVTDTAEKTYQQAYIDGDKGDTISTKTVNWRAETLHFIYNNLIKDIYSILDLGCAVGNLIQFLPGHVKYTGVDCDEDMLSLAREKAGQSLAKFEQCDCMEYIDWCIRVGVRFDVVNCTSVLRYLPYTQALIPKLFIVAEKFVCFDYICMENKCDSKIATQNMNGEKINTYFYPYQSVGEDCIYRGVVPLNATRAGFDDMEGQVIFDVMGVYAK